MDYLERFWAENDGPKTMTPDKTGRHWGHLPLEASFRGRIRLTRAKGLLTVDDTSKHVSCEWGGKGDLVMLETESGPQLLGRDMCTPALDGTWW